MEERPIKAIKAAPTTQNQKITREIAQNAKSCLKRKSCQKVAEQLVESPTCEP